MTKDKRKQGAFTIMCLITILFIVMPLLLKGPVTNKLVAWILSGLKYQEYKSAYLGLVGGILGTWMAITGAIYTQCKFDWEKEQKKMAEEEKAKETDKKSIKKICREILWSEIYQNNHSLGYKNGRFIKAVIEEESQYFYNPNAHRITVDKWHFVRDKAINMDIELAIKLINLYKYYEFMIDFDGCAKDAYAKSQLDFGKYEECYKTVVNYLEYPWSQETEEGNL